MIGALLLLLQVNAADPAVVQRARPDAQSISFRAIAVPETLTVGQQAVYQVGVFVPDEVRQRLRRNPEFVPPELRAMLAYDLPRGGYQLLKGRTIGQTTYEIHVFQRAIFPVTAGRHVITPAELTYSLPLGSSFFSREEMHTLHSEPVTVVAIDPPLAGRPPGWRGAVGRFGVSMRVDTRTPRANDVVIVTARVEGAGNINLLPRPALRVPWGTVTSSSERVVIDTAASEVRGAKEFDYLLTPAESGQLVVPPLRYDFYDVQLRQYGTVESSPETLTVTSGVPPGAAGTLVGRTLPPVRTVWRGERDGWWVRRPAFLLGLLLVPLPALITLVVSARRQRRPLVRTGLQLPEGHAPAGDVRRAFRAAIEERLGLRTAVMADADAVARLLRQHGVTAATAAETARRLADLDRAAFGGDPAAGANDRGLRELFDAIEREARPRARTPRATTTVALALAVGIAGATAVRALAPDTASDAFARGVAAWQALRVELAVQSFARAAELAPRSSDAWANFGEASWAARDTAGAAVGWQRALRLDPLASDVRDRLALLGVTNDGWIAWVPPVDVDHAALVVGLAWCVGWGLLFATRARPDGPWRGAALVVLLVAGGAAVVAVEGTRRAEAQQLVVVRGGESLRALPALGAESSAPVAGGEVAQLVERGDVWSRVTLDLGRTGWVTSERLRPLTAH